MDGGNEKPIHTVENEFQWWWNDLGVKEVSVGTKNGN